MSPPDRVRVTHPRTDAARRPPHRPASREIEEQTLLGEVYMSSLIRSQKRLAAAVSAGVALLLISVALAGALAPRFADIGFLGIPVPWLVLGLLVYPALIGLGWYAMRTAERNERAFVDLVRQR